MSDFSAGTIVVLITIAVLAVGAFWRTNMNIGEFIHAHPWGAVAIAAIIGAVIFGGGAYGLLWVLTKLGEG